MNDDEKKMCKVIVVINLHTYLLILCKMFKHKFIHFCAVVSCFYFIQMNVSSDVENYDWSSMYIA